MKLRADALEASGAEKAVSGREAQLAAAESKLVVRQDQEVNALRQRIQTGAEEQRVARQQALERLLRRCRHTLVFISWYSFTVSLPGTSTTPSYSYPLP